ncbi:MAG: FAD-dependent thymidylate synthase [Chloroflexia bacterium]
MQKAEVEPVTTDAGGAGNARAHRYTEPVIGVKMLFPTPEIAQQYYVPMCYTAARTCYSEKKPEDIWADVHTGKIADEKMHKLLRSIVESGHGTVIEHINFTFAISGVSRALTHQLVRHRMGVTFDQQSQRYVRYRRPEYTTPATIAEDAELLSRFTGAVEDSMGLYADLVEGDTAGGRALPLRERHADEPRYDREPARVDPHERAAALHDGAVGVRKLFALIKAEVRRTSPFLSSFLVIKCVSLGYCDESRNEDGHCKVRPHKNEVFRIYTDWREAQRAADRTERSPRTEA